MDKRDKVEAVKIEYLPGTRIELIQMLDEHSPVKEGTQGTVVSVDDIGTIHMKWDNGRTLGLVPGEDKFKVVDSNLNRKMEWVNFEHDIKYEKSPYIESLKDNLIGILAYKYGLDKNEVFYNNCVAFAFDDLFKLINEKPSKFSMKHVHFLNELIDIK